MDVVFSAARGTSNHLGLFFDSSHCALGGVVVSNHVPTIISTGRHVLFLCTHLKISKGRKIMRKLSRTSEFSSFPTVSLSPINDSK